MNCKAATCLILILILFACPLGIAKPKILTQTDPIDFRNSLHQDFENKNPNGIVVIPEILPQSIPFSSKATYSFADFLISESVGPANFNQDKAQITDLQGSRMAVVWEDNRLGSIGIFLQMYTSTGDPIGGNTALIQGDDFNTNDPHICSDPDGNFFLVWREDANGFLQAARFDSQANTITSLFFVSDTVLSSFAGEFDAACLSDGRLVVAWEDYTIGNDIVFRIFAADGTPATGVITANSDGPSNKHWSPAVAAGPNGDMALAWEDDRSGVSDILFRRFNSSGSPYAAELSLSDEGARDSARFLASITYSPVDGYVAGWIDLRDGQNIYLQQINTAGQLIGSNQQLTSETAQFFNWNIDLDINSAGHVLAAWTLFGEEDSILLQRFQSNLQKDGAAQVVSEATGMQRFSPAVSGNPAGNLGVVWTDLSLGSIDVLGAIIANDGGSMGQNFLINDDALGSPSYEPQVTRFDGFEWEIVFTDMRLDAGDIMLQRLYVGAELVGANRRINADQPGGVQSQPAIAANADKLVISWTDVRCDSVIGQNIFCRFSVPSYDLTPEIAVNDDALGSAAHHSSDCAITGDGIALVVWTDTRSGNARIFGQLFDNDYNKIGDNILIGPSEPAEIGEMAAVSADSNGNFIVSYLNRLNQLGSSVEIKTIDADGQVGDLIEFASDQADYDIDGFDAGVNGDGSIFVVWHGFGSEGQALFVSSFNASGAVLFPTREITDDESSVPGLPSVSVDNLGYLLVTWSDHRTGQKSPFRQIYDASLIPIEGNVPTYSEAGSFMQAPVTDGFKGRGVFVWADARLNGLNIYASQELYEPTDAGDDNNRIPALFALAQNHPNPFNPATVIDFTLGRAGHVELTVLNLLGRKVRTLINGIRPAGSHSIIWDGTTDAGQKVASGIYFYRLKSGDFVRTKKMVLAK